MLRIKYKNLSSYKKIATAILVILVGFLMFNVGAARAETIPAGCKGGPLGPPSPGTICPSGSIPVKDSSLPAGCPGSSKAGTAAPNTVCPARPGRSECTITGKKCLNSDGKDVTKGDWGTGTGTGGTSTTYTAAKRDCIGPNIRANAFPGTEDHCGILDYLVVTINVLSAMVGLVIVAVIIIAGIQFSSAGNDPQKIAAAKGRIFNALLALAMFIFMYAFLQWVVPGGIF